MWSQYYHSTVSQLLLESLLKLCSENIPCEEKLEIDGIICISPGDDVTKQIVIKVHEIVDRKTGCVDLQPQLDDTPVKSHLSSLLQSDLYTPYDVDASKSNYSNDSDIEKSSPEKCILPSKQIVPFTKKKGKNRHKQKYNFSKELLRWANGHQALDMSDFGYQISIDPPTIIEDQSNSEGQVKFDPKTSLSALHPRAVKPTLAEDEGNKAMFCRVCHKYFDKYAALQTHNMELHKRWTCKQCYSTFSMRCNLRRHERLHAGHKPHPCRMCDKAFSRKGDLRIHEMKHEAAGDVCSIVCQVCNQVYSSRSSYDQHICQGPDGDHDKMDASEDSSQAPVIKIEPAEPSNSEQEDNSQEPPAAEHTNPSFNLFDKFTSSLGSSGKVFRKLETPTSFLAEKSFSNLLSVPSPRSSQPSPEPGSLDLSQDSNNLSSNSNSPAKFPISNNNMEPSEDKDYVCCLCKLPLIGFYSYDEHCQRQHLRFPCHLCDQTFTNRNNRSRHVRNHTGNKCYSCDKCGKSFTRSDILREHQIIHTESYIGDTCTYCGIVIKKKAELLAHIKKCCRKRKLCPSSDPTADLATPATSIQQ